MSVAIYNTIVPAGGIPAAPSGGVPMPGTTCNVNTIVAGAISSTASAQVYNPLPVPARAGVPVLLVGPDSSGDYYISSYPATGEVYPTHN